VYIVAFPLIDSCHQLSLFGTGKRIEVLARSLQGQEKRAKGLREVRPDADSEAETG
jgi:hypothetical protein